MDNDNLKTVSVQCKHCGGKIDIDISKETAECPFCGNSFHVNEIISESDAVRIEKIKSQAYKDVEIGKLEHEKEKSKKDEDKEKLQSFKKGKLSKVLIIFSVLSLLFFAVAFHNGRILASIISLVMFILFMGSWAMGSQIVKEPKKGIHILTTIIAFLLIVPYFNCNSTSSSSKAEKIDWTSIDLGVLLPEPKSNVGVIYSNSEESLSVRIEKISQSEYKEYMNECIALGYTNDSEKSEYDYSAYNDEGYKLSLFYIDEVLDIDLDAPEEMSEIQWPKSELAQIIPVPKSTYGSISWEHSNEFLLKIGNTTIDDFKEYVDQCFDSGFNVDYQKGDDYYYADDSSGNHISLKYEGNNIMSVQASAADDDETDEEITEAETAASADNDVPDVETTDNEVSEDNSLTGISPEFKATMDSYEEFFDEYIAIMKKYSESDGTDLSILSDYSSYMSKYAEMMSKFEAIEDEDLSAAETAYYLEVQTRINKKLLEAAY